MPQLKWHIRKFASGKNLLCQWFGSKCYKISFVSGSWASDKWSSGNLCILTHPCSTFRISIEYNWPEDSIWFGKKCMPGVCSINIQNPKYRCLYIAVCYCILYVHFGIPLFILGIKNTETNPFTSLPIGSNSCKRIFYKAFQTSNTTERKK